MRLSKPQMQIYTMDKYAGGAASVLCGSFLLGRIVDKNILANSLNEIVKRNPALRTIICEKDTVEQFYDEYKPLQYKTMHFSCIDEMDRFAAEYAKKPIDIHDCLFEFIILNIPDNSGLLVKLHHIIGDAWTLSLLGRQLNALLEGNDPVCGDYSHYIESEECYIQSKRYARDKAFFIDGFRNLDEIIYLSDSASKNKTANRKEMIVGAEETRMIQQYCQEHLVSPFMLFTVSVSVFFSRVRNNEEKFYLGLAILNRSTEEELNTVGMFINTVPLLINLDNHADFESNLKNIRDSLLVTMRHQKYNYGEILKEIRKESNFNGQLYDIVISYQNAKVNDSDNRIRTKWYHPGIQDESLQIHIDDRDNEGIFRINYDYLTDRFSEKQIERIHDYIMNILHEGIKNGHSKIAHIKMLSNEEQYALMYELRGKSAVYPKDKCIHELFEELVRLHPDRTAVIACDQTLSYDALNRLSNRIAHALQKRGVKPGNMVGIKLLRRSYFIATVLGVLKSGAAYIPIVPDYPEDRIDFMIQDSQASMIIDENNLESLLSEGCEDNLNIHISSEEKCYCRYTSGSTGKPKGVLIRHRNVMNLVHEMDHLEETNVVLGISNVGFDMSAAENFCAIMTGKTLVFADEDSMIEGKKLAELIRKHKVDMMTTTPTKMQLYLENAEMQNALRSLRVISFGGEKVTREFMERIRTLSDAVLSNEYGPTETTGYSTTCIIRGTVGKVTIGKPIMNTQVYIVDKFMNLTPIGVKGELCIAGDGVGLGYLNHPELTSEKFIVNPFGEGNLYKTGDVACWNEEGNIEYIGRNDSQVKIRGLRIELGEIESALMAIDGIEQAVVVVREDNSRHQLICAYYTGNELDAHFIRDRIGAVLPRYMIPHVMTYLLAIPMTAHGKIDKRRLPELQPDSFIMVDDYVKPQTDLEIKLCCLMSQVMKNEKIGVTTDFFDIGLDSLKAIEFTLKAKGENLDIPLQMVYEYPTVRDLANYLNGSCVKSIHYSLEAFKKYDIILHKNVISDCDQLSKRNLGTVVLTGATGFLGSHILDYLIREGTKRIICIVRSEEKLAKTLSYYFDGNYAHEIGIRIIPVVADIGIDELDTCIQEHVDTVIHAAASVKHYGLYNDFERINVGGTKHALELARKNHARFILISTISVSGNEISDGVVKTNGNVFEFDEQCMYVGQSLENVYIRSKFEAERVVLDDILDGVDAKIIRVGNLTNRYSDLRFQPNYEENAFLKRFHAMIELGKFPDFLINHSIEFSPVDLTACGVVKIAEYASSEQTVFHLYNHKGLDLKNALDVFHQNGISFEIADTSAFMQSLTDMLHTSGKEWIYEAFQNDIDHEGKFKFERNIHAKSDFTIQFLHKIGFEWKDINSDYLSEYIHYFRRLGYFS